MKSYFKSLETKTYSPHNYVWPPLMHHLMHTTATPRGAPASRLAQEKQAADNGTLDIVCGFMVIDEDSRTIVLEGASGPKSGLTALLRKVGRAGPNGQAYRALENPEVRFSRRLYTSFDADLKKVGDACDKGRGKQR